LNYVQYGTHATTTDSSARFASEQCALRLHRPQLVVQSNSLIIVGPLVYGVVVNGHKKS